VKVKSVKKLFRKLVVVAGLSLLIGPQLFSEEALWIDVRSAAEYQAGHLSQAVNIPHIEIAERITEVAADKKTAIKLYCGSGRRAGIAQWELESMGYFNTSNEGGYKDLLESQ
jgi:phage shock protein E